MRIAHVAPTTFGEEGLFGGGERYPLELARALAPHVDCRLVAFGPTQHRERDASGLEIVVLRTWRELGGHPAHPIAAGLREATRDADVVHAHQMRSTPARISALLGFVRRRPVVVTDHGLGGGGWGGLLPRLFARFLPVSRHSADALGAPPGKTTVIYGGADPRRFQPADTRRRGVVFVGRITPHKGIDVLLRALPHGVPLTIAGTEGHDPLAPNDAYPQLLRALARDKEVTFAGRVPEEDLAPMYRGACAVVLPSVHVTCYGQTVEISELLGLTAIEAMACATPVICSRIGGLPEIVEDGVTGLLVEPGDAGGLRDAIRRVTADRALVERLGRNGRERVLERFTWDHCAHRCLAVYESLTDTGAR